MSCQTKAEVKDDVLLIENNLLKAEIKLSPFFLLNSLQDKRTGSVVKGSEAILTIDRNVFSLNKEGNSSLISREIVDVAELYSEPGKEISLVYKLSTRHGELTLVRRVTVFDNSAAVRWYDSFESDNCFSGLYYSDLGSVVLDYQSAPYCVNYFSCSDQSNHRLSEFKAECKNQAGIMVLPRVDAVGGSGDAGIFVYKEGPMPDCQPIKGDYDFVWDAARKTVNAVGLGFDSIFANQPRRANGVVIGFLEDAASLAGLHRYQKCRYKCDVQKHIDILTNSWPAFRHNVNEERILAEVENAYASGVDTVFIDDGWFETFMGDFDTKKFPNLLTPIQKRAKELGINVGIWMNPLGMDTSLVIAKEWDGAECHDTITEGNNWNYVARSNDFAPVEFRNLGGGRGYHGVDLCNSEYYNHIKNKVIAMYTDFSIRHFKFDLYQLHKFNTLLGDANIHYEMYRQLLHDLKIAIPDMIISMDVTRRNRPNFDFGLDYGRLFVENRGRDEKDQRYYQPYLTLRNLWSVIKYAPANKLEIEMMPQIEDKEYDLSYILGTTLFGNPLYWGALCEMSADKQKIMKEFYSILAPHRKEILDGLVFTAGDMPDLGNCSAIVSVSSEFPNKLEGYIGLYNNGAADRTTVIKSVLDNYDLEFVSVVGSGLEASSAGITANFASDFEFQLYSFSAK